jgi:hydrogenase nickel incorporation protein HypA/HybF
MHETVVATSVLDTVLAEAEKINAKPITARISCGQLNPINDEALNYAFELASKDTPAEGMKLNIIHIPIKTECDDCNKESDFNIYSPLCPHCKSENIRINPDAPLMLEEIEFEDR